MKWEEVNGHIIQNKKSGSVGSLYNYLNSILPDFFIHTFVIRKQAKSYEDDKSGADMKNSNTAMLQVDFAENYMSTAQDEIQSAHWKQNQITLFTLQSSKENLLVVPKIDMRNLANFHQTT